MDLDAKVLVHEERAPGVFAVGAGVGVAPVGVCVGVAVAPVTMTCPFMPNMVMWVSQT